VIVIGEKVMVVIGGKVVIVLYYYYYIDHEMETAIANFISSLKLIEKTIGRCVVDRHP